MNYLEKYKVEEVEYPIHEVSNITQSSEFGNLAGRYIAAIFNLIERKTFGLVQNAYTLAFFGVLLVGAIGYNTNMFRYQLGYKTGGKAVATQASVAPQPKTQKAKAKTADPLEGVTELPIKQTTSMSFDLSPASPEDLREQSVKGYIERYSKVAVAEMDKFGIPASITMAQAIVESRSGNSVLAVKNNNHFGIKCFSKSCPKGHCTCFTDDHHKDFFFVYKSAAESFRAHSHFLMKYRYRDLLNYGKNYRVWAKGLRDFGYATDKNYDKKLISVIERYELFKLDDL